MQLPLQITIRDIPHSPVLEGHIEKKAQKLNKIYNRIMACRITVEFATKHRHQGNLFNVRIDLTVPGEELPVTKNTNEDVYVALRDAFNDAKRRLAEFASRQNGDGVIHHAKIPLTGVIARIFSEQGYGFIETLDGHEVYFHESVVKPKPTFKKLNVGAQVRFLEEQGEKGPQASKVKIIEERTSL